jgi:hypothetical protein
LNNNPENRHQTSKIVIIKPFGGKMDQTIENTEEMEDVENTVEKSTAGSRPRQFFIQATRDSDKKRLFVGPIEDKPDAESQAASLQNAYTGFVFETFGKVEARRNGLRSPDMGDSIDTLVSEFTDEETWQTTYRQN